MKSSQLTQSNLLEQQQSPITAILYLLQNYLEKAKDEVDSTYALHKIGEKTELANKIEATIANPIENFYNISKSIEENCNALLDTIAIKFFSKHRNVLSKVYKKNQNGHLHYSIVLKKDNAENRNVIFDFFDTNPVSDVIYKFPIYFQFTSDESINKNISEVKLVKF
ncbi:MAG TPA: hypothetical protein VNG53_09730 [Bacteroidia bacterium]|nr:hypothetical protein [Bacteroidia bacterium]